MDIDVIDIGIVKDVEKLKSIDDVVFGTRLFYERGRYVSKRQIPENWKLSGKFIEVNDVLDFLIDLRFTDEEFIKQHNFIIKRKK